MAAWAVAISTIESQHLDQSRPGGPSSPAVAGLFCWLLDVSGLDASKLPQNVRSEQFLAQRV